MQDAPSPTPDAVHPDAYKVLIGSEGWLFLQNDANDSVGQYVGDVALSEQAVEGWHAFFRSVAAARAEFGFAFVQLFAPGKESVYDAFYPHRDRRSAQRPIDAVLALVPVDIPACYPADLLRPVPGRPHSYDKGDHHWNAVGGAIAGVAALRMVGCELPDPLSLGHREVATFGDLDSKISPRPLGTRLYALRSRDVRVTFDSMCQNHGNVMISMNETAPDRSLLILGDSFGNYIQPALANCFRRIIRVHGHALDRRILEFARPDYVLSEMAERFVLRAPPDPDAFDVTTLMRQKFRRLPADEMVKIRDAYRAAMDGPERIWAELLSPALD